MTPFLVNPIFGHALPCVQAAEAAAISDATLIEVIADEYVMCTGAVRAALVDEFQNCKQLRTYVNNIQGDKSAKTLMLRKDLGFKAGLASSIVSFLEEQGMLDVGL